MSLMPRIQSTLLTALGACVVMGLGSTDSALAANPQLLMKTSLGEITLELNEEKAPISTLNFIKYAQSRYYDGTIFHRVMPTFMIQGGGFNKEIDKKTKGMRPPIKNEWKNGLKNVRGSISMARLGRQPDSATSQFFINVVDNAMLDQPNDGAGYAVFGKVSKGLDVVDKIRNTETASHPKYGGGRSKVVPVTPVVIESVRLVGDYDITQLESKVNKVEEEAKNAIANAAEQGKAFLEKNGKRPDVNTTATGLQHRVITAGTGASPKATDRVTVHYRGKLIDGTEFDSSYSRNEPATFPLNGVIPGWTEGLQLMKEGGKSELFIPSELGYGARGAGGAIPPHAALIFEVELLKIN